MKNVSFQHLLIIIYIALCCLTNQSYAQDKADDIGVAFGFDAVNGRNSDWKPVSKLSVIGVEMVLVPPGSFWMGSTADQVEQAYQDCLLYQATCDRWSYELEQPLHEQQIENPFWIDRFEISRAQYNQCVVEGLCTPVESSNISNNDAQPVNLVTWQQAKIFCENWHEGSLPTEAEWEYAARGPSSWLYPWGNTFDGTLLNFCDQNCSSDWRTNDDDGYALTAPISEYTQGKSWVGAYNMSGNLWEWTSTRLRSYPYIADDKHENPNIKDVRVIRGGSYNANTTYIRTQARFWLEQSTPGRGVGFRCIQKIVDNP